MKFIKKNLKWITVFIVMIIFVGLAGWKYYLLKMEDRVEDKLEINSTIMEDSSLDESKDDLGEEVLSKNVFVDIKGAVKKPGVYKIEDSKKVIDVVELAGGFTERADSSFVNLAKNVEDEMVIIIYTIEEVKKASEDNPIIKIVDKQCICPEIKNDACLTNKTDNSISNEEKEVIEGKINLNTATIDELQTLSGIGESKAKAIIEYRENVGKFGVIEDLMKVTGIGEALYEKIKDNITV